MGGASSRSGTAGGAIEWVSIDSAAEAACVSVEEVRRYRLLVGLPPNEAVASSRGARVVKMIGDDAMLVGSDPRTVVEVAADLCAVADTNPNFPPARGAVGYGHTFARSGDYFGRLVNLV